jgi:hypothetical protein
MPDDSPRFHVPLEEADDAPDGTLDVGDADAALLRVHPSLRQTPPAGLAVCADALAPGTPVWLEDARTGMIVPYWPDRSAAIVDALSPGGAVPPLDATLRERLRGRGLFVSDDSVARQTAARERAYATAAASFAADGHVLVRQLLPRPQLTALQRYYGQRLANGDFHFGDSQVERRFAQHNEPIARLFLRAMTDIVAAVVGVAVKPAYAYFASYREGATLEKHIDRAQCEYSISLLVDYEPRPAGVSPWALHVSRSAAEEGVALHQHIGDAIFYKGRELYHWRTALAANQRSTHIFFHYVPIDFSGALE